MAEVSVLQSAKEGSLNKTCAVSELRNCRLISEFKYISCVGEGAFGTIYKVKDIKNDEIVALKKIKTRNEEESIHVLPEMSVLKELKGHENIVHLFGLVVEDNSYSVYLILEYCDYDLARVIDDEKSSIQIKEPQIKCIMHQFFKGVKHIHSRGILHRDLTTPNILFTFSGILKIADFGSAHWPNAEKMSPNPGTCWYRAPELIFGSTTYTTAIDMWSSACIFAELLKKSPIFKSESELDMIAAIVDLIGTPTSTAWPGFEELPFFKEYTIKAQKISKLQLHFTNESKSCVNLLEKLFIYNPNTRYTATECLVHNYFSETPLACSTDDLVPILKLSTEI